MSIRSSLPAWFLLAGAGLCGASAAAEGARPACAADAGWTDPAPPQAIFGNTWYVGTCGISAILVTSAKGHVLIDGGPKKAAALIEANIRALGFKVEDVRYLLNSHEHHDHAGGLARLQRDSAARLFARGPAATALELGHGDRGDPQFLSAGEFPAAKPVERIDDGDTLEIGGIAITAHATPGHTPGSTSWTWTSCEGDRCLDMVYADSLTAISDDSYRFGDEASHPGYLAAFRQSIEHVAALPCDVLLTPHPGASDLWARMRGDASRPLVDAGGCGRYAASARRALAERIGSEQEKARSAP